MAFPEAWLDNPWGDGPVAKVGKKIFAFLNPGPDAVVQVTVKLNDELRLIWEQRSDTFIPAYVGRYGWRGIHLADASSWQACQDGIGMSYGLVAPRRLVKMLAALH